MGTRKREAMARAACLGGNGKAASSMAKLSVNGS